jgi:hypothetical protein
MSHTEYSAQFVQYSSVFLGLEEALQVLTGHKDLKSLLLYVERSPERAKAAINLL